MDMILVSVNFKIGFLFSVTYVVGSHWNCLYEAITMCTHIICVFPHKLSENKISATYIFQDNEQIYKFS